MSDKNKMLKIKYVQIERPKIQPLKDKVEHGKETDELYYKEKKTITKTFKF